MVVSTSRVLARTSPVSCFVTLTSGHRAKPQPERRTSDRKKKGHGNHGAKNDFQWQT
jgi:hypothetical protein